MAAEHIAKGTILQKKTGETFDTIANIMSITPPNMQRDALETTKHNDEDRWRTFLPGLINPGEVSLSVTYDPNDTTHDFLSELNSPTVSDYKIVLPVAVGEEFAFKAFLTSFEQTAEVDGLQGADVTLKLSGPVTQQTSTPND